MALVKLGRQRSPATRRVDSLSVALMAAARAKRIGGRMRERRDELGLTQTAVAQRIDGTSVTKDYVSRWERGAIEPSEAYLDEVADALETTVADLMAGPLAEREDDGGPTPDLFGHQENGASQLEEIESEIRALVTGLVGLEARLTERLETLEKLVRKRPPRSASTGKQTPPKK